MTQPAVAANAQACVWMCAGLISYKLCNRNFDCENCPLDAALRGVRPACAVSAAPAPQVVTTYVLLTFATTTVEDLHNHVTTDSAPATHSS